MKEYTIERLKKCMPLSQGKYEDIDKHLIQILTELNEKGYKTIYSCEGHIENNFWSAYITFYQDYTFSEPIPVFHIGSHKNDKYTKISKSNFGGTSYYWIGSRNSTNKQLQKEKDTLLSELTEWSKKIEPRENNLITKYYLWGYNGKRYKTLGRMISKSEKDKIKRFGEYDEYKEIPWIVDGNKWKKEYKVI